MPMPVENNYNEKIIWILNSVNFMYFGDSCKKCMKNTN